MRSFGKIGKRLLLSLVLASIGFLQVLCRDATTQVHEEEVPAGAQKETTQFGDDELVVGIDLGTTFSVASIFTKKGTVQIVPFGVGKNTLPSFIKMNVIQDKPHAEVLQKMEQAEKSYQGYDYYYYQGIWLKRGVRKRVIPIVGWSALEALSKEKDVESIKKYLYRFKPMLARSFRSAEDLKIINETKKAVGYVIQERTMPKTGEHVLCVRIEDKGEEIGWVTPRDLSTIILDALKKQVNNLVGNTNKKKCVITVPAYFNDNQKLETRVAATYANLQVLDEGVINEPTSAAIAYTHLCANKAGLEEMDETEFLVFDLGGGTLDISYLTYGDKTLIVSAHTGNNFLGGENFNDKIYNHFVSEMIRDGKIKSEDEININTALRLRHLVEEMKISLCTKQNEADLKLREEAAKNGSTPDYTAPENNLSESSKFPITESTSVTLSIDTNKMNELCQSLFNEIRGLIFNKATATNEKTDGLLNKIKKSKEEVTNILYVGGSSRIPGVRRLLMEVFNKANHCFDLDADTCVSVGAAYHAAAHENLLDKKSYVGLIDALPMNIGIKLNEDMFDVMAKSGTSVPNRFTKMFATTSDSQKVVQIAVGQTSTETRRFSKTKKVKEFSLEMPENNSPRGQKLIEVTFDLGGGGDIEVEAREIGLEKGRENVKRVIIKKKEMLMSQNEIDEMLRNYEETRQDEEVWVAKCQASSELEQLLDEIKKRAAQFPEGSNKRIELNHLYSENHYWFEREVKNQADVKDEIMLDKIREKMAELKTAFDALASSTAEEAEGKKEAEEEEYIPQEDL